MMYELWADTGLTYFRLNESDSFGDLLAKAKVLQRSSSVEIRREDGFIYDFKKKAFYRRAPNDVRNRQRNRNPIL